MPLDRSWFGPLIRVHPYASVVPKFLRPAGACVGRSLVCLILRAWRTICPKARAAAFLHAIRNVRRFVEHGHDQKWCLGSIGNPIAGRLDPRAARPGKLRIGAWCRQSDFGAFGDESLCCLQRGIESGGCLWSLAPFVMPAEIGDLLHGSRCVADQRRAAALSFRASALASIRAMLSSSPCRTTSPGTDRPASASASLSARTSSHPAGAATGSGASFIQSKSAFRAGNARASG